MKDKQTSVAKTELMEIAEILVMLQQLPKDKRIAMQYYIKGTLQGIQMAGETTKAVVCA